MNRSKTVERWRLSVVMLFVYTAPLAFGQVPPNRTQTKPAVNETRGLNGTQIFVPRPTTSTIPPLFGMARDDVSSRLERLHLRPMFSGPDKGVALEQKPAAGTTVPVGSTVAVTFGELPRLVLSASPAPVNTTSDLRLTVVFEPPLPAGTPVSYRYAFGDGAFMGPTIDAVVTHRFADVSTRVVSVIAVINDRVELDSKTSVEVVATPPPSDTAQTAIPPDTSTTTTQTATDTSTTTATATPVDTATTSSTTETRPGTSDTTPTTTTTAVTTTAPATGTSSNLLVWIGAAAVVLLLVVTFLLARVLRALNRKPQVQAKSPVAFKGGVRAIEYEIEHPELIRRAPAVGLRGGVRAEEGDDV